MSELIATHLKELRKGISTYIAEDGLAVSRWVFDLFGKEVLNHAKLSPKPQDKLSNVAAENTILVSAKNSLIPWKNIQRVSSFLLCGADYQYWYP